MDPRKFGYGRQRTTERLPSILTDRGKNLLLRVGKRIPDVYFAFRFGAKLIILGATNGPCTRLTTKFCEKGLCFFPYHAFGQAPGAI